jgi:N-acetylglucosamine-6-phosphate deacetylase/6-phosphogluconolactonase/glucosamine-6-phosphate isomerase/deaminase
MIVRLYADAEALGRAAAAEAAGELAAALANGGGASLVVATGLSQAATLAALASRRDLAWERIHVFHLDEYAGLPADHPAAFRRYIRERFLARLPRPPAAFHAIGAEGDAAAECRRLATLVPAGPFDVVLAGIGENGHLAFNDPPADFTARDPYLVVALDEACRRQQVGEGWFGSLADVPTRAVTMSVPRILNCRRLVAAVPDARKAAAVRAALEGPLTPSVPASILRTHPRATIHLDPASATLLAGTWTTAGESSLTGTGEAAAAAAPLDLQLNGFGGVDFGADDLTAEQVRAACLAIAARGGGQALATVITDAIPTLVRRIERLATILREDPVVRQTLVGIHVEGPFIRGDKGYVGAHPQAHARAATVAEAKLLAAAGRGLVRMVTLAPERDHDCRTIAWLADQGILVAAGHCDPSAEQLRQACAAGLGCFTHLGNGCPHVLPRHDNVIHRAIACDALRWITIIPDGVHVPLPALRTWLRGIGLERAIAVTDTTAAGGMGPGAFRLGSQTVFVDADGAAWSADRTHLVGSTAGMDDVRRVLASLPGFAAEDVERLIATNPRLALAGG